MAIMSTAPRTRSPGADEAPGMARSDAGRQEDNAEPLDVGACPPRFRFALSSITCLCDRADEGFSCKLNNPHPALATLFLVILFPVFWALFTSVHDYTLINPNFDSYTGITNFRRALSEPE